jgi:site-specific recombinase XerD
LNLKELNKPKRSEKVMKIIDKGLLLKMIKKIGNSKHKAFIALAFSTGMQLNEIINLEIEDIHFERDEILVNNNNSKKIRILPLSRFTKGILLSYINKYHPTKYLFNGQSNPQYSKKSALNIVQKYIGHNCNFHVIRNSSVVALLKAGADVKRVQKHLGHASKKTTKTFEKGTKTGNLKELLPI